MVSLHKLKIKILNMYGIGDSIWLKDTFSFIIFNLELQEINREINIV